MEIIINELKKFRGLTASSCVTLILPSSNNSF